MLPTSLWKDWDAWGMNVGKRCRVHLHFYTFNAESSKCMRLLLRSQKTGSQAIFLVSGIFLMQQFLVK